mmetsp:Transcript_6726/g.8849  ORF Transcript_6726/g.8849 Transcript_6726/m.8849 type:complete len:225 (-) Transcript_6726:389-1063(-)|eukprot:CAMPEP_0117746512 /NCGR_PEP_ID=MMETSP0947-20121206/7987_1 /TAXON_ID=44440 /ORGANISM="Chattonella subsalsa, Strain CCMP2191" /LENGTH=224 /DNA_ID=CAMNT_0005563843 /DNA_START=447 /DNA_END=1121 /DNA_ORIENTATION=-
MYNSHQDIQKCVKILEDRLEKYPGNKTSIKALAPLKAESSKKLSIKEYRRAVKASPYDADLWTDLGIQLHKGGKWEAAVIALKRGLKVNPRHVNCRRNLGVILAARGEYREAVEHLNKAIELSPTDPDLHRKLAKIYDAMGNSNSAVKHMRIAIQRGPGMHAIMDRQDAQAYRDLAVWNVAQKETKGWYSHDLYDTHRALTGQRFPLPNSDLTYNILAKTKTKG